jgi:hypothetical protein
MKNGTKPNRPASRFLHFINLEFVSNILTLEIPGSDFWIDKGFKQAVQKGPDARRTSLEE